MSYPLSVLNPKIFSQLSSQLKRSENQRLAIFGFNLEGYGKMRMYTFLAERYLSFWFKKYTNYLEWPVIYYDINK